MINYNAGRSVLSIILADESNALEFLNKLEHLETKVSQVRILLNKKTKLVKINYSFFLIMTLLFVTSCSGKIKIENKRTDQHRFVENTNVYLIPVDFGIYRRSTAFYGFESVDNTWRIKVSKSRQSLDNLYDEYSEKNLKLSINAELVDRRGVSHASGYDGFYATYKLARKREIIHLLVLGVEGESLMIKGTYSESAPTSLNDQLLESLKSTYIGTAKEVEESQLELATEFNKEINIYNPATAEWLFAGEHNHFYYYTRDSNYPSTQSDSAWIALRPSFVSNDRRYWKEVGFKEVLGEGYEVIDTITRGRRGFIWIGKANESEKIGLVGMVMEGKENSASVKGAFIGNSDENIEAMIKMAFETKKK